MTDQSEKRKILRELNEADFRQNVLIPLLKRMNYEQVRERHGPEEYGKDITFHKSSALTTHYYAVVAKVGNISGGASGKQNLATIKNQIEMAFGVSVEDVESRHAYHITHVIVWTTGTISNNAEKQIMQSVDRLRNVDFKDGDVTIELLEEHYPAFFTIRDSSVADYFAGAKENYSRLEELRALGCYHDQRRLSVIFVPPTLRPLVVRELRPGEFKKQQRKTCSFNDFSSSVDRAVVIGDAGVGKSTLLRRILLHIIEENEQAARRTPIPILIEFKSLNLDDPKAIEKSLYSEFFRFCCEEPSKDIESDLGDGEVLVLLDGLDELKNEDSISRAIDRVVEFSRRFPRARIILTSRALDILDNSELLPEFEIFLISLLSTTQMSQFVENWFGKNDPIGQKLLQVVNDPASLRGLPATPLTLALVARLYEGGQKEIPANTTELFSKYVELVLGRWDESRNIATQFEWKIKRFVLQKIAWQMHQEHKLEIISSDFEIETRRLAEERGLMIHPGEFLDEIVFRSELLIRNRNGEYEFKHRSFQEFFAAIEIQSRDKSTDIVVRNFLDPWWADAIFFAGGLREQSEDYLTAIMDRVKAKDYDQFIFGMNLGLLAQAAYLVPKNVKLRAIDLTLVSLVSTWDHFCEFFAEFGRETGKETLSHLLAVGVYSGIAEIALGSITLSSVLSNLVERVIRIASNSSIESEREKKKREWYAFLLAMVCAASGDIDDFILLFDSNTLDDPSFRFWGRMTAKEIAEERTWLDSRSRSKAAQLETKLSKRLGRNREHLKVLDQTLPIPLPEPDTPEDDQEIDTYQQLRLF